MRDIHTHCVMTSWRGISVFDLNRFCDAWTANTHIFYIRDRMYTIYGYVRQYIHCSHDYFVVIKWTGRYAPLSGDPPYERSGTGGTGGCQAIGLGDVQDGATVESVLRALSGIKLDCAVHN